MKWRCFSLPTPHSSCHEDKICKVLATLHSSLSFLAHKSFPSLSIVPSSTFDCDCLMAETEWQNWTGKKLRLTANCPELTEIGVLLSPKAIYIYIFEKEMATHSSSLAWQIPWMEKPGGLQSMGVTKIWTQLRDTHIYTHTYVYIHTHILRKELVVPVHGCVVRDIKFPRSFCKLNFIENSRLFSKQGAWNF